MNTVMQRGKTMEQRFWEKVNKDGPVPEHVPELGHCWQWTAGCKKSGYGQFVLIQQGVRESRAHRVSWVIVNGPIPDGLFILHKCDNKKCVNPSHLFIGNAQENMTDMVNKGRAAIGDRNASRIYPEKRKRGEQVIHSRLCSCDVYFIRSIFKLNLRNPMTYADIANAYGISRVAARNVVIGKSWKHIKLD